jgi:hypothetical protein
MCESFIEITVEIRIPFTRTIILPAEKVEEGAQICLNELPELSLADRDQMYDRGDPEVVITRVRSHR